MTYTKLSPVAALLFFAIILFSSISTHAQCDTDFNHSHKQHFDQLIAQRSFSGNRSSVIQVPIAFHIETVNGNPVYNSANLQSKLDQCNIWFADGNIELVQCGDDAFYYEQGSNYSTVNHVINVGIATSYDGCGVYFGSILINPNCSLPFDEILAHEVSHALGVPHTHGYTNYGTTTELVDGSNCETDGDHFCDTPADPNILYDVNSSCVYTGTFTDANGDFYTPDTGNIMAYTWGGCRDHFSPMQLTRMYDVAVSLNLYCCLAPQAELQNLSTCIGTSIDILTSVAVDTVYWYEQAIGGVPFHMGANFTTPILENSISYYVEAVQGCATDRAKIFVEVLPPSGPLSTLPVQVSNFMSSGQDGVGGQGGEPSPGGYISHKLETDSMVYFVVNSKELWQFDGIVPTLIDSISIAGGTNISSICGVNGKILLGVNDWNAYQALYIYDGNPGVTEVMQWSADDYNYSNYSLTALGNECLFVLTTAEDKAELWKTDGTNAGTIMIKDLPGTSGYNDFDFMAFDGKVFFSASENTYQGDLWQSDGTNAGTVLYGATNPSGDSYISSLAVMGGYLYLAGDDGSIGTELWRTDGAGTFELVSDINPDGSSSIWQVNVIGDKLYFQANGGPTGYEPYVSDGTPAGTLLIADLRPGTGSSSPAGFAECMGKVLFGAKPVNGEHPNLYSYDEFTGVLEEVKAFNQSGYSGINEIFCFNNQAYFSASNNTNNYELWTSDGTTDGTNMLTEINPLPVSSSNPNCFFAFNNQLFFQGYTTDTGNQLWTFNTPEYVSCDGAQVELLTANTTGTVNWYYDETSPTFFGQGYSTIVGGFSSDSTFWASLIIDGCESERTPFQVNLLKLESILFDTPLCEGSTTPVEFFNTGTFTDIQYSLDGVENQTSPLFTNVGAGTYNTELSYQSCTIVTEIIIEELLLVDWYLDSDTDGYGVQDSIINDCWQPMGYAPNDEDCDDQNPDINPGAIGNNDNIDVDCDGGIDQTETGCQGDLNFDGIINSTDLLLLLPQMTCISDCLMDMNGDGLVNTVELLVLLAGFGTECN